MGKEIGRTFKYNRSKISTPTLKKPVLSSSANHTSYTTNSHERLYHINLKIKTVFQFNISTTDYIHSCVTPQKQNISVQATSTPPRLTPVITTLPLAPV